MSAKTNPTNSYSFQVPFERTLFSKKDLDNLYKPVNGFKPRLFWDEDFGCWRYGTEQINQMMHNCGRGIRIAFNLRDRMNALNLEGYST